MQNYKAKIVIIGPPESGKSTLANFLSDTADVVTSKYRPTKGCRIVEFEVPNLDVGGGVATAEIELWDVSGDKRYSHLWPVMQRGANGAILLYNPDQESHPRILEDLYLTFVEPMKLRDRQCIVVAHKKPSSTSKSKRAAPRLGNIFSAIIQIDSELTEESSPKVHRDLKEFLSSVFKHMSDAVENQEKFILQKSY